MTTAIKEPTDFQRIQPFGTRLKALRQKYKFTIQEVGDFIGVSPSTIVGYENNRREPKLETIAKLAYFFDTSTDYILGRTDIIEPKDPPSDILEFLRKENLSVGETRIQSREIRQKLIDQYKMMVFYYEQQKSV